MESIEEILTLSRIIFMVELRKTTLYLISTNVLISSIILPCFHISSIRIHIIYWISLCHRYVAIVLLEFLLFLEVLDSQKKYPNQCKSFNLIFEFPCLLNSHSYFWTCSHWDVFITYVMFPDHFIRPRICIYFAFEVDVITFFDVVWIQAWTQGQV